MQGKTIVFDLGGVLIDWNPRHLYSELIPGEKDMEYFLDNICTGEWNELQDAGRSLEEGTSILIAHFPEYSDLIKAYYGAWQKMLRGSFQETVGSLKKLIDKDYRLLALTNWSNETFPIALELFDFLHWFEGILVSGKEKMKKPDPAIFNLLIKRYQLNPPETVFIDDNPQNVLAAGRLGIDAIHFSGNSHLVDQLRLRGIELD